MSLPQYDSRRVWPDGPRIVDDEKISLPSPESFPGLARRVILMFTSVHDISSLSNPNFIDDFKDDPDCCPFYVRDNEYPLKSESETKKKDETPSVGP